MKLCMECRQKKDAVLSIRWHTEDCNCIVDIQRSNGRHRIAIFKTRFAMQSPYEHISKVRNYLIFSGLCGQFLGASLARRNPGERGILTRAPRRAVREKASAELQNIVLRNLSKDDYYKPSHKGLQSFCESTFLGKRQFTTSPNFRYSTPSGQSRWIISLISLINIFAVTKNFNTFVLEIIKNYFWALIKL